MPGLVIAGEPIAIRPCAADDARFIFSTWMRSYAQLALGNSNTYTRKQPARIEKILASGARVSVACSPDLQSLIHGWACGYEGGLHYVYVRAPLRGNGIARVLIEAVLGSYPEKIEITHRLAHDMSKVRRFEYNPNRLGVLI